MHRGRRGRGGGGAGGGMPGSWVVGIGPLDNTPAEQFPVCLQLRTGVFPYFESVQLTVSLQYYAVPIAAPASEYEKREVASYKELRNQFHEGPFYTRSKLRDPTEALKAYGVENNPPQVKSKPDIDPFLGVATYSMKYDRKDNVFPQLSDRPFSKWMSSRFQSIVYQIRGD